MRDVFNNHPDNKRSPNEPDDRSASNSLALFRRVLAFAGMGALLGMLLGATTVGFPIVIASTIIGAIGGAILGAFIKFDD
jgi:membrane associated rhomboid family serine protease